MASGEKIQNQVNAEATNSFYIDGLFIHGAKWVEDEQSIVDLDKQMPPGSPLPIIHLQVEEQQLNESDSEVADEKDDAAEPEYLLSEAYQL